MVKAHQKCISKYQKISPSEEIEADMYNIVGRYSKNWTENAGNRQQAMNE